MTCKRNVGPPRACFLLFLLLAETRALSHKTVREDSENNVVAASQKKHPPIVLLLPVGCSRSTAVYKVLKTLMHAHGRRILSHEFGAELLTNKAVGDKVALMRQLKEMADTRGETFAFKAFQFHFRDHADYIGALRSMGSRLLVVTDYNQLDNAVCQVTDCFVQSRLQGFRVNRSTGERWLTLDDCFRHRGNSGKQDSLIWLQPSYVVQKINSASHSNSLSCKFAKAIDACEKDNFFYSTALLEYEYDFSEEVLRRTQARWAKMLTHVGVEPNLTTIEEVLRQDRGSSPRVYDKHRLRVTNMKQVSAMLGITGNERLIRTRKCSTSTCNPEPSSPFEEPGWA